MPDSKAGKPARKRARQESSRGQHSAEGPAAGRTIAPAATRGSRSARPTSCSSAARSRARSPGRSYPVTGTDGDLLAYAAQASRKDARDAVVAARKAAAGWSGATAYNRGQVLYRVAEMLEGRAAQFAAESVRCAGLLRAEPGSVAAAIDRWVWYAGWPDKVAQVAGAANPVAGPYFNFSVPEPTGVVAVVAPAESGLLGLVSVVAPVIATGNTAVVVASETARCPRSRWPRCSPPRTCRAAWSTC